MSNSGINIIDVELKNAVSSKVSAVNSISSCMGINYKYEEGCEWTSAYDTMMDICYGIVNNTPVFVSCITPNDTGDSKIYIFRDINDIPVVVNVFGHMLFKVFVYENIIIGITTEGVALKIEVDTEFITNIEEIEFPEKIIDATIISNKLWILSPTKLYQINGPFDEIVATNSYPTGIDMQTIVPTVGGNDIIIYANTDQLPMFIRYQITEKKFSVFTSSTPFTIVNSILISIDVPTLFVYASDTKVRSLTLSDNIGFFDFNTYVGRQWVGECTYYDGYVYNQYLDLTTGSPKLFLARSINGISFQIISEEFDYCDEMYGKYCQGNCQSIFISPSMYRIKTVDIYGIDYSRYCDIIEVKDVLCSGQSNLNSMDFDVSNTALAKTKLIDETSFFVNLKISGKSTASTKIDKIRRNVNVNGDMIITVCTCNPNMMNIEDLNDVTADFVVKRIR